MKRFYLLFLILLITCNTSFAKQVPVNDMYHRLVQIPENIKKVAVLGPVLSDCLFMQVLRICLWQESSLRKR